jgi:hypothetical protein
MDNIDEKVHQTPCKKISRLLIADFTHDTYSSMHDKPVTLDRVYYSLGPIGSGTPFFMSEL